MGVSRIASTYDTKKENISSTSNKNVKEENKAK